MAGGLFQAKLNFDDPNGTIDITKRGFTDHEHLDEMQLIHMNGRMFDYNNGRFLSVDPFIQNPTSTQSMNPYTYIFNNPLSGTDPTGYIADTIFDVASMVYDVGKIGVGLFSGNDEMVSEGKIDLAADTAAAFIPFVPAGSTKVARALKEGADAVSDAGKSKTALKNGKTSSGTKTQKSDSISDKGSQKEVSKNEKTYQTYTKKNEKTGETYTGRTSGKNTPEKNVAKRDASHHKNKEGFGPSKLDKSSGDKNAIRGREQQKIDQNKGAKSEGGKSGNAIRGVSKKNKNAEKYDKASTKEFGSCKPDDKGCK